MGGERRAAAEQTLAKHCSSSMRSKSGLLWRPGRRVCAGVCAGRSNTMPTNPTPGGARRHPPASVRDGGAQDCEQGGCAPPLATASALARLMPARCALGESPGEGGEVGILDFASRKEPLLRFEKFTFGPSNPPSPGSPFSPEFARSQYHFGLGHPQPFPISSFGNQDSPLT